MTKLNQILAVEKGVQATTQSVLAQAQQNLAKAAQLNGLTRRYEPKDEDGEQFPPESTLVQIKTEGVIEDVTKALTRLFNVTAIKDWANTKAVADVTVDGQTLLTAVPVTYLLFLEKRLTDLHTFIAKLPVLEPGESWTFDSTTNVYRTDATQTIKTRKIPRNHVRAEATKEHPAQVDVYMEDIPVGTWTTTKFSGALPAQRVAELLERVQRLQEAIKFARETANATEVTDQETGEAVLGYLFAR